MFGGEDVIAASYVGDLAKLGLRTYSSTVIIIYFLP